MKKGGRNNERVKEILIWRESGSLIIDARAFHALLKERKRKSHEVLIIIHREKK